MKLLAIRAAYGLRLPVVAPPPAMGGREDALDAEFLAADAVVLFAFVTGVAEQRGEGVAVPRLVDQHGELDGVATRPAVHHCSGHHVAASVTDGRELGKTAFVVPSVPPAGLGVVHRDVPALHPGGVDGGGGTDQALRVCESNRCVKEAPGAPFFSNRSAA